jgi:hypothetical protein
MAQVTINIPDQHVTELLDAICAKFNYTGPDKAAFAKQAIIRQLRNWYIDHKSREAANQANQNVQQIDIT